MTESLISVVVPTLWKFAPFPKVAVDLASHNRVCEVIVINNAPHAVPSDAALLKHHSKVRLINPGQNFFVNPSWNLGASLCLGSIICLWNDDLIFDHRILELIAQQQKPQHGVAGLWVEPPGPEPLLVRHSSQGLWGFGQLMFLHKQNWIDIPPDLLVYCGDNWIFDTQKNKHGCNLMISQSLYHTPGGVGGTSSRQFVDRVWQERAIYNQAVQKIGLKQTIGFGE
jgi:hypothetical protein